MTKEEGEWLARAKTDGMKEGEREEKTRKMRIDRQLKNAFLV